MLTAGNLRDRMKFANRVIAPDHLAYTNYFDDYLTKLESIASADDLGAVKHEIRYFPLGAGGLQ